MAILQLSTVLLHSQVLVYEGFEINAGPLAGTGSGTGWADASVWEESFTGSGAYEVLTPGLEFQGKAVAGGLARRGGDGSGRGAVGRLVGEIERDSLTRSEELWFSSLVQSSAEDTIMLLFSSMPIMDGGCQGCCRLGQRHAAMMSGLSFTSSIGFQFRVLPAHRSGWRARASV